MLYLYYGIHINLNIQMHLIDRYIDNNMNTKVLVKASA